MKNPMQNPDHWRERAEETRVRTEGFRVSKDQREKLLKIAEEYERLASFAEKCQSIEEGRQGVEPGLPHRSVDGDETL